MGQFRLCNRSTQMQSLEREPPSPTVPRHTVCCCVLQFLGGNAAGAWLMIAPSDPGGTPPNHISLDSVVKELERAIETGSDHALALLGELHWYGIGVAHDPEHAAWLWRLAGVPAGSRAAHLLAVAQGSSAAETGTSSMLWSLRALAHDPESDEARMAAAWGGMVGAQHPTAALGQQCQAAGLHYKLLADRAVVAIDQLGGTMAVEQIRLSEAA